MSDLAAKSTEAGVGFARPYVISWNLTYRCNLACEHCYLDAGGKPEVDSPAFADRSELDTDGCRAVIDQIADLAPDALVILTGGEPLLRRDIVPIIRYAHAAGLWVVVGTNGVKITENLARLLVECGVRGLALSLDALDPSRHDGFRRVRGAWDNTVRGAKILASEGLPFIVQTTVGAHNAGELEEIAEFAWREMGARVWNLYFLVQTGRGAFATDLEPGEYDAVLAALARIQRRYDGRMVVNAKCAPHYVKQLYAEDPGSKFLKTFADGAGGCPAGTHYMGIRPNGDVTPCPYLPVFGGNLRDASLSELWRASEPFVEIRKRQGLGGRCGDCELSSRCGGCRARAFGVHGDLLAEDPLCRHEPGTFTHLLPEEDPAVRYGEAGPATIAWDEDARARIERIPAFVRGMVIRRVEARCRETGATRVTLELLERLRSAMPTPKLFSRPRPGPDRDPP